MRKRGTKLGIETCPLLGFPYLKFTRELGPQDSNQKLYDMFPRLLPNQAALLRRSQEALYDGSGVIKVVLDFAKRFGKERTIYFFDITPEAAEVLAEYGETYTGILLPPHLLKKYGKCFLNSIEASTKSPGVAYIEGLALPPVGFIMHHAWCADGSRYTNKSTGELCPIALDYTWARADYGRYFGIWVGKNAFAELTAIFRHMVRQGLPPDTQIEGFLYHKVWCPEIRKVFEQNAAQTRAQKNK